MSEALAEAEAPQRGGDTNRLAHIDSLRGIACLLVVYVHVVQWLQINEFPLWTFERDLLFGSITHVDPGKVGVLVFFAISGFVVPFSLRRPLAHPLREFVINRFFRLMPAYWLSLLMAVALFVWIVESHPVDLAAWLGNVVLAPQAFGREHLLKVYWTLQVEMIFYVLCMLLAMAGLINVQRLAGWLAMLGLAGALAAAALKYTLLIGLPVGLALWLSLMFWGFAAREAQDSGDQVTCLQTRALFWGYLLAIVPICYFGYTRMPSPWGTWQSYAISYCAAVLIFWALAIRWRWSTPWMSWIGRISYSIYLLHIVCIVVLGTLVGPFLADSAPGVVFLALVTAVCIVVSALAFRWLELPMVAFGRTLNRRWRQARSSRLRKRLSA